MRAIFWKDPNGKKAAFMQMTYDLEMLSIYNYPTKCREALNNFSPISLQYICSEWIAFKLIMLSWVCYFFLCLMILDCWTSLTFNQSFLVSCIYGHPKALFLLKSLISSSINSFNSSNTSDAKYLKCNQKDPLTECLGPWSKL